MNREALIRELEALTGTGQGAVVPEAVLAALIEALRE
jgi:hypothetical protein